MIDDADWTGSDIASGDGWQYRLNTTEIADLKQLASTIRPSLEDAESKNNAELTTGRTH